MSRQAADPERRHFAKRRPDWDPPELHADLRTSSLEPLRSKKQRSACPTCKKSRSLYCHDCLIPLTAAPKVALPCNIHILVDGDARSRNTGVQAAILAPDHITLHALDGSLDVDPETAVLLFPSDCAVDADNLDMKDVKDVILIDSVWKKSSKIAKTNPVLKDLKRVRLNGVRSSFWRFHTDGVPGEGVSTVEAIWVFLKALLGCGALPKEQYSEHSFDDILWYFAHQYEIIQEVKRVKRAKATSKKTEGGDGVKREGSGKPAAEPSERKAG
ncbi:hypothetical protein BSKO_05227 [Bryopsis sp. KO-2023]|nr:hypothetical protein BSKO_05227 [Bryopsis sp. KO-2023]